MRERERWQKEDARRRVRGGGGGGGRWTKMQGREVGCCNENEITGTTRCRDGDKDRAEVRERETHTKRGRKRVRKVPAPVAVWRKELCLQPGVTALRKHLSELSDVCVRFINAFGRVFTG